MAPPSPELLVEVEEQLDCAPPAADDITISIWLGLTEAPAAASPLGPKRGMELSYKLSKLV